MSTHRSRTVVIAALILMATAIIYVYFRKPIPEAEPIWSAHNALLPAEPLRFEDDQDSASLISALRSSLTYYKRLSPQQSFSFGGAQFTAKDLAEALEDLSNKVMELGISTALSDYIYDNYLFFRSAINPVLFTGYYLPLLK
ncbi:MAG: hypothetical protein GX589_06505, partial [Deltaproteobacteria bacterium]|nr:hypothetical protein [Deltaproteobacteria bacterium]